jgi:hypothetical protein
MTGVVKTMKATPSSLQSKYSCSSCHPFLLILSRQDRLQRGYIELTKALPWFHDKLSNLDHEESEEMLKKVFPSIFSSQFSLTFNVAQAGRGLSPW